VGQIGPAAKAAVPALIELLNDAEEIERQAATQVQGRIVGAQAAVQAATNDLIRKLFWENSPVRQAAAQALGRIGPAAQAAIPALIEQLIDCDQMAVPGMIGHFWTQLWYEEVVQAAQALRAINPDWANCSEAQATVPALIDNLAIGNWLFDAGAAQVLGQMGPAAQAAVPALIGKIAQWRSDEAAALALGQIGPTAQAALPALIGILAHWREEVRQAAAQALGQIDPDWVKDPEAQAALPALIEKLNDKIPEVRQAAAYALKLIRQEA
jgi:HEAT repeat protein